MTRTFDYVLADVFTSHAFSGNQLAVFPKISGLSPETMQAIARELNLSETVFVFEAQSERVTCDIRIFTPGSELPFAGHPTIGTALVLDAVGALKSTPQTRAAPDGSIDIVLGEGVGPVPVRIARGRSGPRAILTSPLIPKKVADAPARDVLARLLGLPPADIATDAVDAGGYSAGVPFLFIPLRDRGALSRVRFDTATWSDQLRASSAPHVLAITMQDYRKGREVDARMFAPALGIAEDPATGGAAAALAGFLADRQELADGTTAWTIRQGFDMGRPSIIDLEADHPGGALSAVRVGGSAVLIGRGSIDVP